MNHATSAINLCDTRPLMEDDALASPSNLYEIRSGSFEDFPIVNANRNQSSSPNHNVSNPCHMVDDLHTRRTRPNGVRFGLTTTDQSAGLSNSEAQICLTNRTNRLNGNRANNHSPTDEPLDRSIIFTNSTSNGASANNMAMRNLSLENSPRTGPVSNRLYSRHQQTNQQRVVRRRLLRDTADGSCPSEGNANTSSTQNGVGRRERSLMSVRTDDRRNSVPVRTAYRSRVRNTQCSPDRARPNMITTAQSRENNDREIHVRHAPNISVVHCTPTQNDAPSTTSISGASSIEDVRPATTITPDVRRLQSRAKPVESGVEDTDSGIKVQDSSTSSTFRAFRGSNDWREDAEGTKELWRRMLENERFADVWFTVGGTNILSGASSSCIASPDHGAPGGPTSATNYSQNSRRSEVKNHSLGLNSVESNHVTPSLHQSFHDQNGTESITLSQNTGPDPEMNRNDMTDVGSDLDDDSPTNHTVQSNHATTDAIPVPSNGSNLSNSRKLTSSYPPNGSKPQNLCEMMLSQQDVSRELMGAQFADSLPQSGQNQIPYLGSQADGHPATDVALVPPSVPPHRKSADFTDPMDPDQPLTMPFEVNKSESVMQNDNPNLCWRFGAHKLVLAAASPVFEAMFFGPVAEMNARNAQHTTEYQIPDIHPKAFQTMLLYIYTDEIELDDDLDIVFYVLYAAKKYMLPNLGRRCVDHLKEQLTASNVCAMLDRSLFFDEEDLTNRCWHVIDVLASNVLSSSGLLRMDANNLKALLKRDTLNCKESEVFAAVRNWAAAECVRLGLRDVIYNRAQIAADLLHLVRFPTMTLNDFAENVAYSGFLSLEMVRDLFVHITANSSAQHAKSSKTGKGRTKHGSPPNTKNQQQNGTKADNSSTHSDVSAFIGPFQTEPRTGPKLFRCTRFTRTGKHLITPNASNTHQHSIVFQVSNSVFLAGIGLYGSTQMGERLQIRAELSRCAPKPVSSGGVTSVGTQYHGPQEERQSVLRSPSDQNTQCMSAPAMRASGRSTSLFEFARFDWSGRPQPSRRMSNHQGQTEDVIIHIPSDLSRRSGRNANADARVNEAGSDQNSLAVVRTHLESDGSSRVYEIFFTCPVKIMRNVRYVIHVQTTHAERTNSMPSSTTPGNSSTLYIGLFGRPEVRVTSSANETKTTSGTQHKREHSRKSRAHASQDGIAANANTSGDNRDVVFRFSENADDADHGEVDRGFLPELLFYACS